MESERRLIRRLNDDRRNGKVVNKTFESRERDGSDKMKVGRSCMIFESFDNSRK